MTRSGDDDDGKYLKKAIAEWVPSVSGLVSLGTCHVTDEDSPTRGEKWAGELGNTTYRKRGLTC